MRFALPVVMVAVAASYLTLGAAARDIARDWWAVYAGVTFVLAVVNLWATKQ